MTENEIKFLYLKLNGGLNIKIEEDLMNLLEEKDYRKARKLLFNDGKVSFKNQIIRNNNIMNFILNYSGEYSLDEMSNIFNINKRTIINIINNMQEEKGIKGKSRKRIFVVDEVNQKVSKFKNDSISSEEIKKIYILIILIVKYSGKVERKQFTHNFINEKDFFENDNNALAKKNYIDSLIRELIEEEKIIECGSIIKVKENILKYDNKNLLEKFKLWIDLEKQINPKRYIYKSISNKLNTICNFGYENLEVENSCLLSSYDEEKVILIQRAIIESRYLSFKYKVGNENGFIKKMCIFPLGLIYSEIKDSWYLEGVEGLGKRQEKKLYKLQKLYDLNNTTTDDLIVIAKNLKKKVRVDIKVGQTIKRYSGLEIIDLKYVDEKEKIVIEFKEENEKLLNIDYRKILDFNIEDKFIKYKFNKEKYLSSFNINNGKETKVKVIFDRELFIERKLLLYKSERESCYIDISLEKIVLEDKVSDLMEFKAFINSFGKSAICVEPPKLIEKCKNDLNILKGRML